MRSCFATLRNRSAIMKIEIVLRTNEFFLLSLPAEREGTRERLPTAPAQLKMKGFDYKKITRFALQIFLLYVKFPSFSKRCSDDVGFTIQMNNCSLFSLHCSLFIIPSARLFGLSGEAYNKSELRALKAAICRAKRVFCRLAISEGFIASELQPMLFLFASFSLGASQRERTSIIFHYSLFTIHYFIELCETKKLGRW